MMTVKSDSYSFGVLLYECLTRRNPFEDQVLIESFIIFMKFD